MKLFLWISLILLYSVGLAGSSGILHNCTDQLNTSSIHSEGREDNTCCTDGSNQLRLKNSRTIDEAALRSWRAVPQAITPAVSYYNSYRFSSILSQATICHSTPLNEKIRRFILHCIFLIWFLFVFHFAARRDFFTGTALSIIVDTFAWPM